jgi:hypothetical protein
MSSPKKTRLGVTSAISACALILGVFAASPALAATCSKNGLSADVTPTAAGSTTIKRGTSGEILVNGAACGAAMVTNIDTVKVITASTSAETVILDLSGGAFQPGFDNADPDIDEIEFEISLGTGANAFTLMGTDAADTWEFQTEGIDITNDVDVDITGAASAALSNANLKVTVEVVRTGSTRPTPLPRTSSEAAAAPTGSRTQRALSR